MKSEAAPCQAALLEPVFSPPDADRRATLSPLPLLAALSAESFRSMLSAGTSPFAERYRFSVAFNTVLHAKIPLRTLWWPHNEHCSSQDQGTRHGQQA